MAKEITYTTTSGHFVQVAFGTLVFLAALVPCIIVAVQWLTPGAIQYTSPGSLIPGSAIILWGLWLMTDRETVTVNADLRTLTWKRSSFGRTWRSTTWHRTDLQAIETIRETGLKYSCYNFILRSSHGRRSLFTGTKDKHPQAVRDTAKMLDIPVEPLAKP